MFIHWNIWIRTLWIEKETWHLNKNKIDKSKEINYLIEVTSILTQNFKLFMIYLNIENKKRQHLIWFLAHQTYMNENKNKNQ